MISALSIFVALSAHASNPVQAPPLPAHYTVTYSAPSPIAIENEAVAAVKDFELTENKADGSLKMTYTLPRDLEGPTAKKFSFNGMNIGTNRWKFKAKNGWMICHLETERFLCVVDYEKELKFDAGAIRRDLTARYSGTPDRLKAKLAIAKAFSTDPIGILELHFD